MGNSNHYRTLLKTYTRTALIAVLFIVFVVPFVKQVSKSEVGTVNGTGYMVVLNGQELGLVDSAETAEDALLSARTRINSKTDNLALVESDMQVYEQETTGGVMTKDTLENAIYTVMSDNLTDQTAVAYTVRIDDFTVTLASKEEITELLEKVKNKYSDSNEFTVELVNDTETNYDALTTNLVSADITTNEAAKVLASADGTDGAQVTEETVLQDGVLSVDFAENIQVVETVASDANVVSVDEAYELVTKEHDEKEVYEVKAGDCLTSIAEKNDLSLEDLYAINENLNEDTVLYEGDMLTITVPASELSVVVIEESTYDEKYNADVQYVDNPNLYVGTENVIQNGSEGYREVVALIKYVNGAESERDIINQTIIKESVPTIIEKGTLTPPTYIKPVNSYNISSYFGYRYHPITGAYSMHTGVDWYVPIGTAVKASASGTVISAGWNGGYGYCVKIQHSDGSVTVYGHLSQILVASGQSVTQGDRIALSGSTGNSTGPHLHFEVIIGGSAQNPLDYVSN